MIGATPVSITGLAIHPTTRVLYGVTGEGNLPGNLVTINKTTAAATLIGSLGIPGTNCGNVVGIVGDIAFGASGILYGAGPCGPSVNGNLYTINTPTGAATFVGAINFAGDSCRGLGLSFLPLVSTPQQLFVFPQRSNQNMYVINPTDGAILSTIPVVGGNTDAINSLTTDPAGTTLLGVKSNRSGSPTTAFLVAINPSTGAITVRGAQLPGDIDALALDLQPAPTPTPTSTATATSTQTPTSTATSTPTSTATATLTSTATPTSTATSTSTPTPTVTVISTPNATATTTNTGTLTPTSTGTTTATPTATPTSTATSSPTATPTGTLPTPTPSAMASPTATVTSTATPSATATQAVVPLN